MSKQTVCALVILCFIPLGCATKTKKTDSYLDLIKAWNGRHIDELAEKAGYPHKSFIAPNGNKVFVYSYVRNRKRTDNCTTYFETDNNGIIVKCSYKGNACE